MTSLKKEERKRKKNWKGQLQNCGHHLERVLSVLLNQLPRIGCPFNARTCPFSFLSLSPSVEGRKKGFGIKRTRKATPKQPVIRSGICLACACVRACVRGATRAETPWHSANWRHHATPPELFNYFGGGVGWQPWSAGRRDHAYTPLSPWNRVPVNEKPWFPRGGEKERGIER